MIRVLNPTYVFRLEFKDEISGHMTAIAAQNYPTSTRLTRFFDPLNGKSGCDECLAAIKDALSKAGINCSVTLEKFEHT